MQTELTSQQKKLLLRLAKVADGGELAVIEEINTLEERIDELTITQKGDKGDKPVAGVDYPIPENGKDYVLTEKDKEEIALKVEIPVIEKVVEKTETIIKEQPIVTEITKEVAVADTGKQIVDKINDLPIEPDYQIAVEHIKGLEKLVKELQGSIGGGKSLVGRIGDRIKIDDLTARCDGVTITFELEAEPKSQNKILVWGTQFPIILRPNVDFTIAGKFLTLTSEVSAPQSGQTLLVQYTF